MTFDDTTLTNALALLAGSLDDPAIDLAQGVSQLTAAVRAAVPSYRGFSITLITDGIPVTITDTGHSDDLGESAPMGDVVASLVVPLSAINRTTDGELVLFASAAGAFVDLAADLAFATATELVTFAFDTRFGSPAALTVGVAGFSVIHQAVGILVDTGQTPEQARTRVAEIAAADGHDLAAAADRIVHSGQR